MQVKHLNKEGGKGQAFYSQYWGTDPEDKKSLDNSTQAAYDFILGNYNKDAKGNDIKGDGRQRFGTDVRLNDISLASDRRKHIDPVENLVMQAFTLTPRAMMS